MLKPRWAGPTRPPGLKPSARPASVARAVRMAANTDPELSTVSRVSRSLAETMTKKDMRGMCTQESLSVANGFSVESCGSSCSAAPKARHPPKPIQMNSGSEFPYEGAEAHANDPLSPFSPKGVTWSRQISSVSNVSAEPHSSCELKSPTCRRGRVPTTGTLVNKISARLQNILGARSSSKGPSTLDPDAIGGSEDMPQGLHNNIEVSASQGGWPALSGPPDDKNFVDLMQMSDEARYNPAISKIRDWSLPDVQKSIDLTGKSKPHGEDTDAIPSEWMALKVNLEIVLLRERQLEERRQELETEVAGLRAQRDSLKDALSISSASQQKLQGVLSRNTEELQEYREKYNQAQLDLEKKEREAVTERERANRAEALIAEAAARDAEREAEKQKTGAKEQKTGGPSPKHLSQNWLKCIEGVQEQICMERHASSPSRMGSVIEKSPEPLPGASATLLLAHTAELCSMAQEDCATMFSKSWNILQSIGRACDEIDQEVQESTSEDETAACSIVRLLQERTQGWTHERTALIQLGKITFESMARCYGFATGPGSPDFKLKAVSKEMQTLSKTCIAWAIESFQHIESHWSALQETRQKLGISWQSEKRCTDSWEAGASRNRRISDQVSNLLHIGLDSQARSTYNSERSDTCSSPREGKRCSGSWEARASRNRRISDQVSNLLHIGLPGQTYNSEQSDTCSSPREGINGRNPRVLKGRRLSDTTSAHSSVAGG